MLVNEYIIKLLEAYLDKLWAKYNDNPNKIALIKDEYDKYLESMHLI